VDRFSSVWPLSVTRTARFFCMSRMTMLPSARTAKGFCSSTPVTRTRCGSAAPSASL